MEIFVVPDIWNLLAQWGATLILFLVIRHFVYKPVNEFLTKRQNSVVSEIEEAEELLREAEDLHANYKNKLQQARKEGAEIIEASRERGRALEKSAMEEAKARTATMIEKAEKDIEREKEKALKDVRVETADLAVMIAEKLLRDKIDVKNQDALVDGLIDDLEKNHV
ncbi:MAG: F0F1 ATP synthase subunit B [Peptoniphilus sp.]|nr:F0F1 ATP synthase subunit B [Peptoniphilus sp.]MDY3118942.1 F0F1 ATP synthase subunit B [Peptoniphilus sp.]